MKTPKEKKDIISLCSFLGWLKDSGNMTTSIDRQKAEALREKVIQNVEDLLSCFTLTQAETEVLKRDVRDRIYEVVVLHQAEKVDHRRKVRKQPITVRKGDFEDLIEQVLTLCEGCTRNHKACQLRKVLKRMDVVALDPNREKQCEYRF